MHEYYEFLYLFYFEISQSVKSFEIFVHVLWLLTKTAKLRSSSRFRQSQPRNLAQKNTRLKKKTAKKQRKERQPTAEGQAIATKMCVIKLKNLTKLEIQEEI